MSGYPMHRIFKKEQILTIPNLLSLIRLLMIPLIVWLYIGVEHYLAATGVLVASGITDIADGIIARKFHMVSDLGKILDPIADKLTQGVLIICLASRYKWMSVLVVLFIGKELCMAVFGYLAIKRKDSINSAKWYGKVNTAFLYIVMFVLILFPNIPEKIATGLILTSGCVMIVSFILYARFYRHLLSKDNAVPHE